MRNTGVFVRIAAIITNMPTMQYASGTIMAMGVEEEV
jgi:hypothetical protein